MVAILISNSVGTEQVWVVVLIHMRWAYVHLPFNDGFGCFHPYGAMRIFASKFHLVSVWAFKQWVRKGYIYAQVPHFENWQSYMQKIPSIFVYNLTFLALETLPLQSKHKQLGKKSSLQ